ncbi:hypothetical protein MASR1M6_14600 [Rubrivivax sp.]
MAGPNRTGSHAGIKSPISNGIKCRAANVRLIAERRYGELLAALARATAPNPQGVGGRSGKVVASGHATQQAPSPYAQALADTGTTVRLRDSAGRTMRPADATPTLADMGTSRRR